MTYLLSYLVERYENEESFRELVDKLIQIECSSFDLHRASELAVHMKGDSHV